MKKNSKKTAYRDKSGNGKPKEIRKPKAPGPTPLKKVASGFFAGVPNVGAETIVFNDKVLNQSIPSLRAGVGNAGIHVDLAYALDGDGARTFKALTNVEYATLNRYAGHDISFSVEEYSVYRSLTFLLDACIQEARRDLLMFKWRDSQSVDAFADYWGRNYQVVLAQLENLPAYRVKYANLAARAATSYPHTTMPIGITLEYLLGNVFLDDDTGKAHYIYFHMFNNSLLTNEPSIDHCIKSIEALLSALDELDYAPEINAAVVKAYGSEAYRDYLLVTDDMGIKPIYDNHLINALNNISNEPRLVGDTLTSMVIPDIATTPILYDDSITEVIQWCLNNGYPSKRIYDSYEDLNLTTATNYIGKTDAVSAQVSAVPRLYFGPDFAGEAAVGELFFTASMLSYLRDNGDETGDLQRYLASAHGIVAARGWTNQRVSTAATANINVAPIIFDFSYFMRITGNDFTLRTVTDSNINEVFEAVRQVELVDAGNITIYACIASNSAPTGMIIRNTFSMAERIDDYAVVDTLSYQLVKDSVLNSYFDNGSARFVEPKTSTVINYSAVK